MQTCRYRDETDSLEGEAADRREVRVYDTLNKGATMKHRRTKRGMNGAVRVVGASGYRIEFPSMAEGRMMQAESFLELDLFYLLEVDPSVKSRREQGLRITYTNNGEEHWHVPDLVVENQTGRFIVEVKPSDKLDDPDVKRNAQAGKAFSVQNGYNGYLLMTELEIRKGCRLDNAKKIYAEARKGISLPAVEVMIGKELAAEGAMPISDLIERIGPDCRGMSATALIYSLIYRGVLAIDVWSKLTSQSVVYSVIGALKETWQWKAI
jgi:hypothetical protein